MRNKKRLSSQQGIVSIVVTIILMLVITLIVLSFAKISRKEQRNATDRQLSTQAFYAAESGVNDAITAIQAWPVGSLNFERDYLDSCDEFAAPAYGNLPLLGNPLEGSGAASYTCVFVDPTPTQLVYTGSDNQRVFPVRPKAGSLLSTVEIYWDDGSGSRGFLGCPTPNPAPWQNPRSFIPPDIPSPCNAPVLRVEIVDANNLSQSKVYFVYPHITTGDDVDYATLISGLRVRGSCFDDPANSRECKTVITNLPNTATSGFYLRILPIYGQAGLTVEGNSGLAELVGAQAVVDVTGLANDVERRIQARVKTSNLEGQAPVYGVHGTDKVCKQFTIDGTGASDLGSCLTSGSFPD